MIILLKFIKNIKMINLSIFKHIIYYINKTIYIVYVGTF